MKDFWAELVRKLHAQHRSETWLAGELNVSIQTLASWKQRGQFRADLMRRVAGLLGWDELNEAHASELGVTFVRTKAPARNKEVHPTEAALQRIDKEYIKSREVFERYASCSQDLFKTLGENCFFAFSACTTSPYEFEDTPAGCELAKTVAEAIHRGTLCLYIRPTEQTSLHYKNVWAFEEVVEQEKASQQIADFRMRVKQWLMKPDSNNVPAALTAHQADQAVYERLDQCYVERSPMWMPGIGLGMIGWNVEREMRKRMTISLPGARFGGVLVYPSYQLLEFRFDQFVRKVVADACREVESLRKGNTRGHHVQLYLPKGDRYLKALGKFYGRCEQLIKSVYSFNPSEGGLTYPYHPDYQV